MDLREEGCACGWNWPRIMSNSRPNVCGVKSAGSAISELFISHGNRDDVD
jgi:hypothetical protein